MNLIENYRTKKNMDLYYLIKLITANVTLLIIKSQQIITSLVKDQIYHIVN